MISGAPECSCRDLCGNKIPVSQKVDVWSLGCVLSMAATWMVSGPSGIRELENRIKLTVLDAGMENHRARPRFHDGKKVLPVISNWHKTLRRNVHINDHFTTSVLDLVDNYMLQGDPKLRLNSKELYTRFKRLLQRADNVEPLNQSLVVETTPTNLISSQVPHEQHNNRFEYFGSSDLEQSLSRGLDPIDELIAAIECSISRDSSTLSNRDFERYDINPDRISLEFIPEYYIYQGGWNRISLNYPHFFYTGGQRNVVLEYPPAFDAEQSWDVVQFAPYIFYSTSSSSDAELAQISLILNNCGSGGYHGILVPLMLDYNVKLVGERLKTIKRGTHKCRGAYMSDFCRPRAHRSRHMRYGGLDEDHVPQSGELGSFVERSRCSSRTLYNAEKKYRGQAVRHPTQLRHSQTHNDACCLFPCAFSGYGYQFTFNFKSEWKLPVVAEHTGLYEMGTDPHNDNTAYRAAYSRKDFFIALLNGMNYLDQIKHSNHPRRSWSRHKCHMYYERDRFRVSKHRNWAIQDTCSH